MKSSEETILIGSLPYSHCWVTWVGRGLLQNNTKGTWKKNKFEFKGVVERKLEMICVFLAKKISKYSQKNIELNSNNINSDDKMSNPISNGIPGLDKKMCVAPSTPPISGKPLPLSSNYNTNSPFFVSVKGQSQIFVNRQKLREQRQ